MSFEPALGLLGVLRNLIGTAVAPSLGASNLLCRHPPRGVGVVWGAVGALGLEAEALGVLLVVGLGPELVLIPCLTSVLTVGVLVGKLVTVLRCGRSALGAGLFLPSPRAG